MRAGDRARLAGRRSPGNVCVLTCLLSSLLVWPTVADAAPATGGAGSGPTPPAQQGPPKLPPAKPDTPPGAPAKQPLAEPFGLVTMLEGEVEIEEGSRWRPARLLERVSKDTRVRTGSGGRVELATPDGALVLLGPRSSFALAGGASIIGDVEVRLSGAGSLVVPGPVPVPAPVLVPIPAFEAWQRPLVLAPVYPLATPLAAPLPPVAGPRAIDVLAPLGAASRAEGRAIVDLE